MNRQSPQQRDEETGLASVDVEVAEHWPAGSPRPTAVWITSPNEVHRARVLAWVGPDGRLIINVDRLTTGVRLAVEGEFVRGDPDTCHPSQGALPRADTC